MIAGRQQLLQLQAVGAGHGDVGHQAARSIRIVFGEERIGGSP